MATMPNRIEVICARAIARDAVGNVSKCVFYDINVINAPPQPILAALQRSPIKRVPLLL